MQPILKLINPFHIAQDLWQRRVLTVELIKRELGQRYRGSYLGVLWSLIVPLVMLVIYTFVFSVVFKARWQVSGAETPPGEFAFILFAAITGFNVFSDTTNRAPSLVVNVPSYVKKVVFPLEVLPVVGLSVALITSLINVVLVLVGWALFFGTFSATLYLLPLAYLPLILLCLGMGWFLASLGVYVRDTVQLVPIVVQVLFFLTPIFYPASAVPPAMQTILQLNPLTVIVTCFRQCLLWGQTFDWGLWGLWTALLLVFAAAGYAWFMKTKRGFADVL